MTNRALSSVGLRLGSVASGPVCRRRRRASVWRPKRQRRSAPPATIRGRSSPRARTPRLTCDTCHEIARQSTRTRPISPSRPASPATRTRPATTTQGVHGQARKSGNEGAPDCALCHGSAHELLPPKSQAFRTAVPDTCGMCHTEVVEQFRASVHGQALARGVTQAPLCTDCHGEHKILKHTNAASPVNNSHIRDTCGSCHGDVRLTRKFGMPSDRLVSFDSSFHGLAAKSRLADASPIAPVATACTTFCPPATPRSHGQRQEPAQDLRPVPSRRRARASPSARSTWPKAPPSRKPLKWVRQFYLLIIPVTIGLMLLHQRRRLDPQTVPPALPGQRRGAHMPRGRGHGDHEVRMLPFERVQHAVHGDLLHDAGLDRLRPEVPRPVVGAPAAAHGGRAPPCAA